MRRWAGADRRRDTRVRQLYARVIAAAVSGDRSAEPPSAVRLITKVAALRTLLGYAVAIGPFPEHTPAFARR